MKPKSSLRQFLALAGSSVLAISSTNAATVNWEGDTINNLWATAGNWDTAPANSLTADIANFNLTTYGGNPVWAPTVGTATSINGIIIGALNGPMTLTNTAALSIGDSGINIANGAGAFTISGSTTLGASQSWNNNSGNLFTFGAVTNGANLLTIGGSGNTTASGAIGSGAGGLTKEGVGTLTLTANASYTGTTTINGGILQLGNGGATGTLSSSSSIVNNGSLVINHTSAQTLGAISGTGSVTMSGTNTLTLSNSNTFSGGFTLNSGSIVPAAGTYNGFGTGLLTINATTGDSLSLPTASAAVIANDMEWNTALRVRRQGTSGSGLVTFDGGLVLNANSGIFQTATTYNVNATFNGNISEDSPGRSFTFSGSGAGASILTLNGQNTFTGNLTNSNTGGSITIGGSGYLGGGNYAGIITATGAFTYNSTATQTLSGSSANAIGGMTTVTAGTLELNKSGAVNAIGANGLTIGSANNNAATVRYTGTSTDMIGASAVTINGRGVLDLNGRNDAIGNMVINSTGATGTNPTPLTTGGGNLTIGSLGITPAAGLTTVLNSGTGTLTLGGNVTFTAATSGQAQIAGNLAMGGSARTFGIELGTGSNQDVLVDAVITGTGGLIKSGSGRLTLSAPSYTGNTDVNAGTLTLQSGATTITRSPGGLRNQLAEGTLVSNKAGTGDITTTFSSYTRAAGATGNIVSTGGTNGTDNTVNITGAAGFINAGLFFNGSDYAARNALNGYVRALAYGTDASTSAVDNIGSSTHVKLTTSPVSQNNMTLLSLNLQGGVDWTNNSGQTLTTPGILKSGGGSQSSISGGNVTGGTNTELVIRTDTASDSLAISSILSQGSGVLTKSGAGTLTLSGANTYTGQTHVNAGTLSIGANVNLGAEATGATLNLKGGTLQATGTFGLFNGTAGTNNRAVTLLDQSSIEVTGTNTLTIAGVISNNGTQLNAPGFNKTGTGTLVLSGANTYTGTTNVNAGELRWGANNAIAAGPLNINDGGTANIQGFSDTVGTITIAKGGSITGTTGTITTGLVVSNDGGTFSGFNAGAGLNLYGGITYNSTGTGSNTLQIDRIFVGDQGTTVYNIANGDAAIDFEITEILSGGGNNISRTMRKTGAGVMQFSGSVANTTSSNQMPLEIWDGTVIFNKSAEVNAIPNSAITIGDGIGSAGSAILQYRTSNNQIQDSSITISGDGLVDLNGRSETTSGALTVNGGSITTGAGTLTLGNATNTFTGASTVTGNLTFTNASASALNMGGTASINGTTTFTAATNNIGITATGDASIAGTLVLGTTNSRAIAVTGASDQLTISAQMTGNQALNKSGNGSLTLSSPTSSWSGALTVQTGALIAGADAPSGSAGAFGNATSDVTLGVASGNTAASILTGGAYNIGRNIRNATTNTTDAGTRVLTLGGNTAHNSEFSGNIFLGTINQTSKGIQLTAAAGGQVTFSGVIQNPTGQDGTETASAAALNAVTKVGAGTVILSNANTYTGATVVNQGVLEVSATGSIANTSGITINTGGELKYGNNAGLNRNVTVNGGTFRYNASTSYSGTLTYTSGTLAGTNLTGALDNQTIGAGKTISPGNSPGTMSVGSQTWSTDGSYEWEINNAQIGGVGGGTAGADPGWDLLSGTGTLTIDATSSDPFVILVNSLTLANAAGLATNFINTNSYAWLIADFGSAITTFDESVFNIDITGFQNTINPQGVFGISRGDSVLGGDNTQIYITYAVIPEPGAALLGGLGMLALLRRRRSS